VGVEEILTVSMKKHLPPVVVGVPKHAVGV
jgi:hypothetical protein